MTKFILSLSQVLVRLELRISDNTQGKVFTPFDILMLRVILCNYCIYLKLVEVELCPFPLSTEMEIHQFDVV